MYSEDYRIKFYHLWRIPLICALNEMNQLRDIIQIFPDGVDRGVKHKTCGPDVAPGLFICCSSAAKLS